MKPRAPSRFNFSHKQIRLTERLARRSGVRCVNRRSWLIRPATKNFDSCKEFPTLARVTDTAQNGAFLSCLLHFRCTASVWTSDKVLLCNRGRKNKTCHGAAALWERYRIPRQA